MSFVLVTQICLLMQKICFDEEEKWYQVQVQAEWKNGGKEKNTEISELLKIVEVRMSQYYVDTVFFNPSPTCS